MKRFPPNGLLSWRIQLQALTLALAGFACVGLVSCGGNSSGVSPGAPRDSQPPTAPSNVTAIAASSSQINLSWTASTDNVGVTGYRVERCSGANCTSFAQISTSVTTTFDDTGLAASTSYSYRVRATDLANNLSPYSAVAGTSTAASTSSATPALVQHASGSRTDNNSVTSYTISLPDGTQVGNCVVVGITAESGRTITVTDDQSNNYNLGNLTTDSGNSQIAAVFYALNVAAGTRTITVAFNMPAAGVGAVVSEFYNVATAGALDGNSGDFNGGSSVSAGSITTTSDNDLIYQFAAIDSGTATSFAQGASPWMLLSADLLQGQVAQYAVQTVLGAINPTLTQSPSANSWATSAIALKAATAGSASPASIRIVHLQHNSIGGGSTQVFGFPCSGNMIVVSYIGSSTEGVISSISDSNGNFYSNTGTTLLAAGKSQMFYAKNAVCSTGMTMTLTMTAAAAQATAQVYDITGADPATPFDSRMDATGNQGSTGNFNGVTITPANSNGIIITSLDVANGFISALPGARFDSTMTNPNIIVSPVDENNGWGHFYNSNPNAVTFVWTSSETAASTWGSIAVAFKAAGPP